jgi:hypothetical protein
MNPNSNNQNQSNRENNQNQQQPQQPQMQGPPAASKRDVEEAERKADAARAVAAETAQVTNAELLDEIEEIEEALANHQAALENHEEWVQEFADNAKHKAMTKKFNREEGDGVSSYLEGAREKIENSQKLQALKSRTREVLNKAQASA